jgi:hypothetical protein
MLLGYKEWTWDETEVEKSEDCDMCQNYGLDYPCDWEYQFYADWKIGELLPELSATLSSPGSMDEHWEYGIAMGYVGWMNSFGQTQVKEVNGNFLKYMVFDTINDSNITAKLDFSHVNSGVIVLTRSHHDRPMGETIYIFKCEEDEVLEEDEYWTKLYDLGLEERPKSHTIVITSDDTTVGEWEVVE